MDCIVHGVAKSRTRLSDFHFVTSILLWRALHPACCVCFSGYSLVLQHHWLSRDLLCGDGHSFLLVALECVDGHKSFSLGNYVLNGHCAPGLCEGLGIPWLHECSR